MPQGILNRTEGHLRRLGLGLLVTGASIGAGVATASEGGIVPPDAPKVTDVRCLERCLDERVATVGGTAELTGRSLSAVETIKLAGRDGAIEVAPSHVSDSRVAFELPEEARSGKPVAKDPYGNSSKSPNKLKVKPAEAISEAEGFKVKRARAVPKKSFYNGSKPTAVSYLFEAEEPADVRVDVVRKNGKLVDSLIERDQQPFANHEVTWDGLSSEGKVAPSGKYRFKVKPLAGGDGDRAGFKYYDHIFPLKGRHQYGDGLGAGRGHNGQDVFARCGAKVVAARGGRVQVSKYHGAAGYYVVIDGAKTGVDYMYSHLAKRGRVKEGQRVKTGDVIGFNSDTGNASGCHVHFEMWSAPGWYEGGSPINPTKHLKRWDRWS